MPSVPSPNLSPQAFLDLLALPCEERAADPPARVDAIESAPVTKSSPLDALYRKHHRLVYRLALRYGKGNVAWAEDITQEVFLDLLKALPELNDHDDLGGWLYRATTNRCFRRMRRERFFSLAPVRWLLGEQKPEPERPDAVVMARDDLRRAMEALSALPEKEQIAFSMYYLDGKQQEEIGAILGHSKGYVCKLIQRAESKLAALGWEVSP